MEKTKFDWTNIFELGKNIGIPQNKKRAILREYLQCHFLKFVYVQKNSQKLSFAGGTSLRLLHNLDRFSEDLNFDNLGLLTKDLSLLFTTAAKKMTGIGFGNELKFKKVRPNVWRGYLRFGQGILKDIGLSPFKEEKLMIKIEVMKPQFKGKQETLLLNRFGVLENIITYELPIILSQKSLAVLLRKPSKGRDFYDVVWLLSQKVRPDFSVLRAKKIKTINDYQQTMLKKYSQIKPQLKDLKQQLLPFLINGENIRYLDFFDQVIKNSK